MTRKIFRSIIAVALAILLACLILIVGVLYDYFAAVQNTQLKAGLELAAEAVETAGRPYLEGVHTDKYRLTWVAEDGTVLFDSQGNVAEMENHGQREEIREAMETGTGQSARYSATLTEQTLYYARRLSDGTVLRISVSRMTVLSLVMGLLQPVCLILAVALILSAVLAHRLSKKVVEPLNTLDLDKPLENAAYDEISPLLRHIEEQHRQIRRQKQELARRQDEFLAVTRNMTEGLVLLNPEDVILSMNPAAAAFFGAEPDCAGREFLTVERSREITKALDEAKAEGRVEKQVSRNGRVYQFNASRIGGDEEPAGMVLLIFDVTENIYAERNRQEFTANVSHELKTPLQSIMGSAELMENGLVKPEDMPQFISRIRSEAARLVALIQDILHLSQLDEGVDLPMEPVDLYETASAVAASLQVAAGEKGVRITVSGEKALVSGVLPLMHEMVYNLCENAVKYNKENGSVDIIVENRDRDAAITVRDTGIGIPPEHQNRVFERFYRVDKSHSRQIGGTGLGLSIVKHAASRMGGTITLQSRPGEGTAITVTFPRLR